MKAYFLCGGIARLIFKLGAIRTAVVSLVSRPPYSRGKCPRYPFIRKMDGSQIRSRRFG